MLNGIKRVCLAFLLFSVGVGKVMSEPVELPPPGARDTCPVCGMFVAKYPSWVASVRYRNGHLHHFDGAKDLYKYLLDLPRWAPGHQRQNIDTIGVTEYYSLGLIDAHQAWYVIGSDVLGPMGHELIPLESEEDAKAFLQDHQGVRVLRHDEVTQDLLEGLDQGVFE